MKKIRPNPFYTHANGERDAQARAEAVAQKGQDELNGFLDTAIRYRDDLQAAALLTAGGNPNTKDGNNVSVLGHAISSKHLKSVELLLSKGADPDLRTGLGNPLSLTIYSEQWDMMRLLLKAGVDVNAIGSIRSTALHVMVEFARDAKLVKLLLEQGAEVNARDAEGLTPLDWAERNGDKAIVRLLKAAGAKPSVKVKATKPSVTKLPKKKPVR